MLPVLSPIGSALLGETVGTTMRWTTPAGNEGAAEIKEVLLQPESSGDFVM